MYKSDRCIGYFYVKDGHIGPMAVEETEDVEAAFDAALAYACRSAAPKISAFIPGASGPALRLAIERKMRIALPMLFMSKSRVRRLATILSRNPGFM